MTEHAPASLPVRPRRSPWWDFTRVMLVAAWVLWAVGSLWTAPRESDAEHARADLAAGRVAAYDWADGWSSDESSGWSWGAQPPSLQPPSEDGRIFAWRTTDGRVHWTTVDLSLRPAVQAAGISATGADDGPVRSVLSGLSIGLALVFLLVLVSYPGPVRGTRWFWFWLVSGVPYGLGLLVWLAAEAPWSRTARPREPRLRWYLGIAAGFLGSFAIGLLVIAF